ncbi:MAG TPA: multidrug efflux SMR transporter [Desulfurella acetivorans]|uniref:Multidrug efflux SMR transporter n=1 Tax=Desulfurella acetivorans TaxID=33002 RepID=A0A7C6A7I2_DESAE|nr:multidrug efflux SMR transporter [Desulfurella acetivorans]
MGWVYLAVAILFEVGGTTSMRLSNGFTKLLPSVSLFVCYAVSFVFATMAMKYLKLAVVYAVWSGVGIVATVLVGLTFFHERINSIEVLGIILILAGSVILRVA